MKPTPITDACYRRAGMMLATQNDELDKTCRKLETLLGEARSALEGIAKQPLSGEMDDHTREHADWESGYEMCVASAHEALARIDASLDPDNLEGPGRTRDEMAADARELNRIAPTPAEKLALMFGKLKETTNELSRRYHENETDGHRDEYLRLALEKNPDKPFKERVAEHFADIGKMARTLGGAGEETPKTEQHREVAGEMRIARENASAEGMTADEFREQSKP